MFLKFFDEHDETLFIAVFIQARVNFYKIKTMIAFGFGFLEPFKSFLPII